LQPKHHALGCYLHTLQLALILISFSAVTIIICNLYQISTRFCIALTNTLKWLIFMRHLSAFVSATEDMQLVHCCISYGMKGQAVAPIHSGLPSGYQSLPSYCCITVLTTPCPEKNGTTSVLGITVANRNI